MTISILKIEASKPLWLVNLFSRESLLKHHRVHQAQAAKKTQDASVLFFFLNIATDVQSPRLFFIMLREGGDSVAKITPELSSRFRSLGSSPNCSWDGWVFDLLPDEQNEQNEQTFFVLGLYMVFWKFHSMFFC